MKALAGLSVAIAAIGLSPVASAHTRVMTAHAETASVLQCLLNHGKGCNQDFVARAGLTATPWLWWTAAKDFDLGALVSWKYAGTESQNAYTTKFLNGMTADVYDVKFDKRERTFYIVPPGPDGKVRFMLIRNGAPEDERADLWARNPLGLF
jgi:hypothetical protein